MDGWSPAVRAVTHGAAGGQEVDDVVVKLGHMVAHEHLGVSVPGPRVVLSHVHPQDRAHDPDDKPGRAEKTSPHSQLVSSAEAAQSSRLPHSFTASALDIITFSYFLKYDGKTVEILQRGTNLRACGLRMLSSQSCIMESSLGGCETLNLLLPLNTVPPRAAAHFANICKSATSAKVSSTLGP